MFILRRKSDGKFVARSGSKNSYTTCLQKAEYYLQKEDAQRNACGNENVQSVDSVMYRAGGID